MGTDLYHQPGIEPNFNTREPHHPRLIGLSGYARSGKDTVAGIIEILYGHQKRAFADNVRSFVYRINPSIRPFRGHDRLANLVDAYGWEEAKQSNEVRYLLQETGTTARTMFGLDVWLDSLFATIPETDSVVITDVRFTNEAERIRSMGGVLYRVKRPGVYPANDHISETDLDDYPFDAVLLNDGSVVDLQGEVMIAMGDL